ncbi:hypothetical protein U1Q18_016899 [Sarracenia purpurea var. burkii]
MLAISICCDGAVCLEYTIAVIAKITIALLFITFEDLLVWVLIGLVLSSLVAVMAVCLPSNALFPSQLELLLVACLGQVFVASVAHLGWVMLCPLEAYGVLCPLEAN